MENTILTYTGTALSTKAKADAYQLKIYKPADEVIQAVNLAGLLKMPLLLMGEPGCGKTRLAEAVAVELHNEKWKEHYFRWDIKSSSKAKDGICLYDALGRLYDANAKNEKARHITAYLQMGEMLKAYTQETNGDLPNILLIDEIDKADIDFPNDLLFEIEKGEFMIPELNKKITGHGKVLVFITSNRERELPDAFLRRCLYQYIPFPKRGKLIEIIEESNQSKSDPFIEKVVDLFLKIREQVENQFAENEKKPATSELLNWMQTIDVYQSLKDKKEEECNDIEKGIKAQLAIIEQYDEKITLADLDKIPFRQVLLKTYESNKLFEKEENESSK